MNRPIKFRVWDGERMHQIGDGHTLFVITATGGVAEVLVAHPTHVLGPLLQLKERLDCIPLQFTGLHDADGKEIYEGDLIRVVMPAAFIGSEKSDLVRSVEYGYGAFYIDGIDDLSMFNHHRDRLEVFKVIGNIYEHPHLVTQKPASEVDTNPI